MKKKASSTHAAAVQQPGATELKSEKDVQSTSYSPSRTLAKERSLNATDRIYLPILSVFAMIVRFWNIGYPHSVVFDEVHFGGFARKYIIGRFFMDVHPPLAKMLYAVVGWAAGYDGEFEFTDIGKDYLDTEHFVPYVAMRYLPATMGVLTCMLAYATLRASGCRSIIAAFGMFLMIIDNALTTQSRYILLDSPLLFFMAVAAYGYTKFRNEVAYTKDWFRYLFLTGLGLGATFSSKWVGLFTIGWVGMLTVYELWWMWGDLNIRPTNFAKQFMARLFFFLGVPILFYMGMFALHFVCVVNYGDGASFMSPEFQATLQHSHMVGNVPADVAVGSVVSLRHVNTQGGYLHSHEHMYETGSQQQQITLYPHKDDNNMWVIERTDLDANATEAQKNELKYIENGMVVRLRHVPTWRRLHSHADHRPPVSEQDHQNEVTAYGYEGFEGDLNDNFRVEILESKSVPGVARDRLRTLHTKFRLIHTITGCALFSHSVKLPKWAFEQQEVTCITQGTIPNTVWYIEENSNDLLGPNPELVSYRVPSFLEKFIELNKVMWKVNAGLTDTHAWQSRPDSWPLLKRGINFWVKDHRQVYLLGNGMVWWAISAVIAAYGLWKAIWIIRWQRGYRDMKGDAAYSTFDTGFGLFLVGWAVHYFPSFLMDRQLFLHHYLGSLYFGILALAQFWEFLTRRLVRNKVFGMIVSILYVSSAIGFFAWYSPLIYGNKWTKEACEKSKFLDMDFSCDSFLGSYSDYKSYDKSASKTAIHTVSPSYATIPDVNQETPENVPVQRFEPVSAKVAEQNIPIPERVDSSERNENPVPKDDVEAAEITPADHQTQLLSQETAVVYRDEHGNILDDEQVKMLRENGNVEFRTRRTKVDRVIDAAGHVIREDSYAV